MLWSGVVAQLVYACRSALPGLVVGTSSTATPFLATAATALVSRLEPAVAATALAPTVLVFLAVAGFLNGVVIYVCGVFNLGRFLHFFPLNVTKGFFAAVGVRFVDGHKWCRRLAARTRALMLSHCASAHTHSHSMMVGGLNMSASLQLTSSAQSWSNLLRLGPALQFASCLCFGFMCKLVKSKATRPWAFPVFVLAVLALFYAVLFLCGSSVAAARSQGWIFQVRRMISHMSTPLTQKRAPFFICPSCFIRRRLAHLRLRRAAHFILSGACSIRHKCSGRRGANCQ